MRIPVLVLLLCAPLAEAASEKGLAFELNGLIREQAAEQVREFLPPGKFTVKVELALDPKLMSPRLPLPLGSEPMTDSEIRADVMPPKAIDAFDAIRTLMIRVSVLREVSPEVRKLIQETLLARFPMERLRGELVVIDELPESFTSGWLPNSPKPKAPGSWFELVLGSAESGQLYRAIGLIAIFLAALFFTLFTVKAFGDKIVRETTRFRAAFQDQWESRGFGAIESALPPSSQQTAMPVAPVGESSPAVWSKADAAMIHCFLMDCRELPRMKGVAHALIAQILPADISSEVEKSLPTEILRDQVQGALSSAEVSAEFQNHFLEYRRCSVSSFSKLLLTPPVDKLVHFVCQESLSEDDCLVLIGALTPLRREAAVSSLTPEMRFRLAEAAMKPLTAEKLREIEERLASTLRREELRAGGEQENATLAYLSQVLLSPRTFGDDEAMHQAVRTSGNPSRRTSPLAALELLEAEDWRSANLQEVALAYFGYSQGIRDSLSERFEGKSKVWLKAYMEKYRAAGMDFGSRDVMRAQEAMKTLVLWKAESDRGGLSVAA